MCPESRLVANGLSASAVQLTRPRVGSEGAEQLFCLSWCIARLFMELECDVKKEVSPSTGFHSAALLFHCMPWNVILSARL